MSKQYVILCLILLLLGSCGTRAEPAEETPAPEPSPTETGYTATGRNNPGVPAYGYDDESFISVGGFTIYTASNASSHIGVDVSAYQSEIDWPQVKGAGVEFAMIRAGFRGYGSPGNICQDSRFEENIRGALDAGLKVGVYFFSQAVNEDEAREEAETILGWIEPYNVTYPVVFDWENVGDPEARTHDVPAETVTACANAFCGAVEEAGYIPMVYFNRNQGYGVLNLEMLADWEFWLACYDGAPGFSYSFQMWQYSYTGSVPGITLPVDLDLCMVDYPAQAKAASSQQPEEAEEEPPGG